MPNNSILIPSVGVVATNDPLWDYVVALFDLEGTHGETTTLEKTGRNSASFAGGAQISTAQKKFGNSSLYTPGTFGGLMTIPHTADFSFVADYCIDLWIYPLTMPSYADPLGAGGGWMFEYGGNGAVGAYMAGSSEANHVYTGAGELVPNLWQHMAISRQGDQLRFFFKGILIGTRTVSGTVDAGVNIVAGGRTNGNGMYNGYMDMIRITNGHARFTSNFDPEALLY